MGQWGCGTHHGLIKTKQYPGPPFPALNPYRVGDMDFLFSSFLYFFKEKWLTITSLQFKAIQINQLGHDKALCVSILRWSRDGAHRVVTQPFPPNLIYRLQAFAMSYRQSFWVREEAFRITAHWRKEKKLHTLKTEYLCPTYCEIDVRINYMDQRQTYLSVYSLAYYVNIK